MNKKPRVIKVGGSTKAQHTATAIAEYIKKEGVIELTAMGVPATYEATLAIIYAKANLAASGYNMSCSVPCFTEVEVNKKGEEGRETKTAIKWIIKGREEEF